MCPRGQGRPKELHLCLLLIVDISFTSYRPVSRVHRRVDHRIIEIESCKLESWKLESLGSRSYSI